MKNILLSCIGSNDPFSVDNDGKEIPGPLLTLLEEQQFDKIYLFVDTNPRFNRRAGEFKKTVDAKYPKTKITFINYDIMDPTDYEFLYEIFSEAVLGITQKESKEPSEYYIQVSSGTPQMQWVWITLVSNETIKAKLLEVKPRYIKTVQKPYAREIVFNFNKVSNPNIYTNLEARIAELEEENRVLKTKLAAEHQLQGNTSNKSAKKNVKLNLNEDLEKLKRVYYAIALQKHPDNASKAAELLGISPHTFRKEADRLGLRERAKKKG